MEVALKIDVDTHQGLAQGVPRMARMLAQEGVAASFFIAMGPDNSGRAIVRVLRNPGFLAKMRRTRAVRMYGLRTVLSGTLLPARPIALALPAVVRGLKSAGFEVGVHGWDHVRWQDRLDQLSDAEIRAELEQAFEAYRAIFRAQPASFAAPGWRTNASALRILDTMGLAYRSDTRGRAPFRCRIDGRVLATPEIPTTLPTLDEVMGRDDLPNTSALLEFYLAQFSADRLNVHTVHAETEGMSELDSFTALVRALKERGAKFVRLDQAAARLRGAELAICEIVRATLPGRAGWISVQGPDATSELHPT
ncbi:MAG TPA: polysaccharide deacetylase family protein [Candidatus Binataceae bacterium]|nr:polysaccharide deacetylase family protein [Candidatus Binataceae bacterium]